MSTSQMIRQDEVGFEIAQTLRKSHCDRKSVGGEHECVGQMTVKRGTISLACELCGKGEMTPGWSGINAIRLDAIFRAAGVSWDSLNLEAQIAAIQAFEKTLSSIAGRSE